MKITDRYNQAREDYECLVSHHNAEPSDITGGYVDGELFMKLYELGSNQDEVQ